MQFNIPAAIPTCVVVVLIALSLAYLRLSAALAKADQILLIWEHIAEMPFIGAHVGRIFTMLLRVRNPYSRSIGACH